MEPKYLSVTDITNYIKLKLDSDVFLQRVYVRGEISNFKDHSRGHYYFSLKDEKSKISAVMFSYYNQKLKFTPTDGMKVLVVGRISVYETTGTYQIYVEDMIEDGLGNLYVAFNELKKKLEQEGLFASVHKKPIPKYPKRIGIITSPTGAAIRDILSTIERRYPVCETILFPAIVQGSEAKDSIAKAIRTADQFDLDVLIVGRGGGSLEDLWAFNEEIVARAIFSAKTPIISAVGHETDFTISDFVADLRAPTPTGAAEIAVPNIVDVISEIKQLKTRLINSLNNKINNYKDYLNNLISRRIFKDPMQMYLVKEQKLDQLLSRLIMASKNKLDSYKIYFNNLISRRIFQDPTIIYLSKKEKLNQLIPRLKNAGKIKLKNVENEYIKYIEKLSALNPLNIIKRGYAAVTSNEEMIASVKALKINDLLNIRFKDGIVDANVVEIKEENIEEE
jgi:exodeoxyribonuclease VII large subunit